MNEILLMISDTSYCKHVIQYAYFTNHYVWNLFVFLAIVFSFN
jgi:hypothetical protein